MARAPAGGPTDDLGRFIDIRAFRVSHRTENPGTRLARFPVGSTAARVGSLRHIRRGDRRWPLQLGNAALPGLLTLAFLTHVVSASLVIKQSSFPNYPSRMSSLFVSLALAVFVYLPLSFVLSLLAWPAFEPDGSGVGFLVNRGAYRSATPRSGQWVWMRRRRSVKPRAAQVVAVSGQEVEWTGRDWTVDGQKHALHSSIRLPAWPLTCRFRVPANQILVEPQDDGVSSSCARPGGARRATIGSSAARGPSSIPFWDTPTCSKKELRARRQVDLAMLSSNRVVRVQCRGAELASHASQAAD